MRSILCIVLLIAGPSLAEQSVQRLFFTQFERAELEKAREKAARPDQFVLPNVSGFVQRSDGNNTVWIDGVAFPAGPSQSERAASLGPEVPVNIRSTLDGTPPRLRTGVNALKDRRR
jgi:hypothetical protein